MPSLTIRKRPAVAARTLRRLFRLRRCPVHAADLFEPLLQTDLIEASNRQRSENAYALMQHSVCILECKCDLSPGALGFGWIGNTPMCCHRLTGPHRTDFACRVVAHGESKIE